MSSDDIEQDDQETSDGGAAGGGGDEQFGAGGDEAVDSAFVVPGDKQPLSKGTLAMFLVIALAGAGTYYMYVKTGPQAAAAGVDPKAQQVIRQFMSDRDKNLGAMQKMLKDTETVVKQFMSYPSVKQVPLSALTANPFRMTAAPADQPQTLNKDDEREKKQREEERVAVLKAVNALQLQSVMHSDARRSCMINNALYTEGQQVETFTIEKISPNAVVVRNGSYRFELRMQR
jgi:hypothetical protein